MHLFRSVPVLALALLVAVPAVADKPLFTLKDRRGDDHGDGSLLFPESADIAPGELDLVSLKARRVGGGTEFEAGFAKPIREPDRRPLDGFILLSDLARHGFYNFNLDIYVDTDRAAGSGRVVTLPGRLAEVQADFAWEKVVCLTPRPNTARSLLRRLMVAEAKREIKADRGTVRREDLEQAREQVAMEVAEDVYFPSRVRVTGRSVRFYVPDTFLGGPASPNWGYVVGVTGCDLQVSLHTREIEGSFIELPFSGLFVLPIKAGGSRYTFGSREPDVEMLPRFVDLIVPEDTSQEEVLRSFDVLAERRAQLPGVVPGR